MSQIMFHYFTVIEFRHHYYFHQISSLAVFLREEFTSYDSRTFGLEWNLVVSSEICFRLYSRKRDLMRHFDDEKTGLRHENYFW